MSSIEDSLKRKEAHVLQILSTNDNQNKISQPALTAISFTFHITTLIKSKKKNEKNNNASFLTYSLNIDGFKDWYA